MTQILANKIVIRTFSLVTVLITLLLWGFCEGHETGMVLVYIAFTCYALYNTLCIASRSLTYISVVATVRPIKKFTFRSYGTVSLFNYVRARYAGQLTYL